MEENNQKQKTDRRRKTHNEAELWARRTKEFQLWTQGVPVTHIAEHFGVDVRIIYNDLKKMAMMDDVKEMKSRINGMYMNLIRRGFRRLSAIKPNSQTATMYMRELSAAIEKLAKVHGFQQDFNINNTMIQNNVKNNYDILPDEELKKEYQRRLLLKGDNAKSD